MPYRTTKKVDEDIIGIYLHGVKNFGQAQAEKYHAGLEKTFALLNENPDMARERMEFHPPVHIHFHEVHVVVYVANEEGILILRVLPGRQDWESYLS
jgi:toxin ParE1/3/4